MYLKDIKGKVEEESVAVGVQTKGSGRGGSNALALAVELVGLPLAVVSEGGVGSNG